MKDTIETRLGLFFALALLAAFLIMEMLGNFDFFKGGIRIHARFNTVQELKEGDPVKMAGVQIGRVEKIELTDYKVDVTMKLDQRKAGVKTDSKATIKFAGLMGQNFVSISFGSPTALKVENDSIIESAEGKGTLGKFVNDDAFYHAALAAVTNLNDTASDVKLTIGQAKAVMEEINEGKGTIGKLAKDDALYKETTAAMTNLKEIFQKINQGQGSVGQL